MNKIKKIIDLIRDPKKISDILVEKVGEGLSSFLVDKPFFLQEQMDIHPKSKWSKPDFILQTGGFYIKNNTVKRDILPLEPWDNTRKDIIVLLLRAIIVNKISGNIAELGVYKGNTAKLIHHYIPERDFYLFDTFVGFTDKSIHQENHRTGIEIKADHFSDTNIRKVIENIQPNKNVHIFEGFFPENLPDNFNNLRFAFVHLDADLYEPTKDGLELFYPRMSKNGIIMVHDYNAWPGARNATDDFLKGKSEIAIPLPDKSGSAIIIKQ